MQTVPSLVGTGTAIAAAASGLVFGQPTTEPNSFTHSTRRPSHSRRVSIDREPVIRSPSPGNFASSRPATSNTAASVLGASHYYTLPRPITASRPPLSRYQRPPMPQTQSTPPPQASSRRSSFCRHPDSPAIIPESRESVSSNGSWIRRLSIRPLSRHESTRSSVGPDAPSIFSHGSAAPILRSPATSNLPRNKLVKRSTSTRIDPDPLPRRRAKSHLQILPVLRRPATSHQRSATLQLSRPDSALNTPTDANNFSFDDPPRPHEFLAPSPLKPPSRSASIRSGWKSYFHSKRSSIGGRPGSSRFGEFSPHARGAFSKRIVVENDERSRVHLVKPRMVSRATAPPQGLLPAASIEAGFEPTQTTIDEPTVSSESTPSRTPRKSNSMPFASAGTWAVRTTGSIRRPKRGAEPGVGNKRRVSEPLTGAQFGADLGTNPPSESTLPAASPLSDRQGLPLGSAAGVQLRSRKRNSSSPIPPPPRLANFHMDASRLGYSAGVSTHQSRPNQPSGSSTSSTAMSQLRASQHDRTSTMESSECDIRDCTSGDDDDTDFKSDTMFDSIRTVGSGRARAVETPLESMYDESPPSTAGNGTKTKRLSIHEMLSRTWEEDEKIMEEDENASTPVRTIHRSEVSPRFKLDSRFNPAPHDISTSANQEYSRLSLDDEFDDDWARDDEFPCNPLSPPSKGSSLNSRGINPNVRLALANISGNGLADTNGHDTQHDRPLSSLFDWSEPPAHDKFDTERPLRPKTSYTKEMDSRGGRSAMRKGPTPTHVRSQSVPVVHDAPEDSKTMGSKYGTWGMGTKTISEDWDDDFEFGANSMGSNDKGDKMFAVPESIRATQPSVKAHSGHIREFSLLVNDLKRLCRHGRDMNMLDGPQKGLWKEADGIIALASPDEESLDEDDDQKSTSSINFDAFDIDERFGDEGFDAHSMNRLDAAFDGHEPPMSKTTVVRERHSPRRRSVFSPEDDIFGNWPGTDNPPSARPSRPRTPDNKYNKAHDVSGVVRSVIGAMQHRVPDQTPDNGKVHFDTNSLKALVKRAGDLRDLLSDIVRQADQITQSPMRTPRNERQHDSSPAFTRVFDDPGSSPPRRVVRSRGNNSLREAASSDNSPSSGLPQRMQMMTVN
ncbi:Ff.00g026060.m01.CDS01 [Fusarium sp. VM40]|nr:Ff.00g026060.m01.CDS01 [Fusarium sp. VM40]